MWRQIGKWFQSQLAPRWQVSVTEEAPLAAHPNVLYVVGDPEDPWLLTMVCPCGCRETIHLSLLTEDRPCWSLTRSWFRGTPTISPSIWRTHGCRSHFFLRDGRIVWATLDGPSTTGRASSETSFGTDAGQRVREEDGRHQGNIDLHV